ncbi:uncharacterized protein [Physcomitrium patens]|uniref:BRCT domain-containing protein n=1 Tax=Physcomitrium patens TaxID=3218 RepID=A0A2K1KSU0_PHYPA|nr:DNA topoisomerase 2-binding protein 1-like [Physcomitrium patens]XP_024371124.1 DNA topoisomerase 2-binding protein 1-like [Physcomitrium patens]XP_024371125.1 DNA topoisomerase 2-binding protein 1-like [Physcomitrium patens]XP_024371126.1 DNA topoisomerase 2-binding protein 1-like [Physcomitrium patens]XP_024371127.1 DNA topoisomerase 2-binding protein 1-like [Physcomitrium patens]XP_024371128.1 DNA topoisomerase 2-binding protein 1-like [Physcomitrium patens]XP_024371129.1 DNA topoisomer|eukprot:XP_024371123.1 DNA topoisomerase 2-binding protein 1-like [Physcomitrella patens]
MSVLPGMAVGGREGGPPFLGLRVFLPRNYVPPEKYSALQDALAHQGAEVFLNLNPFSNSNVDYHVLADFQVDKIKDMRAKGCKVVGPECVLRCAREGKRLPDRDYTCCLALEGVSVLLTGFSGDEKKDLEELVTSMDGTLLQQPVREVDFVVAKDVLATKYRWASDVARKPALMSSWLRQCAREHRQVPHDPHKMLPLAGLTICATGIMFEDRYRIQDAAQKYGAAYHADLTRECSHLIALLPEGRKYQAGKDWGLKVVSQNWFWESINRKLCLDEACFPVVPPTVQVSRTPVGGLKQEVPSVQEQGTFSSPASNNEVNASGEQDAEASADTNAERRQSIEKDSMYLSGCRVFLTGFNAAEMKKQVNLVLAGGGTRHMEMNDTITHVILGSNSAECGMKEIRQLAMWGAVYIVQPAWLEECTRQRRELSADPYLVSHNVLLQGKEQTGWVSGVSQSGKGGSVDPGVGHGAMSAASGEGGTSATKGTACLTRPEDFISERTGLMVPISRTGKCFAGIAFGFTNDYPLDQRDDIIRRIVDHGGVCEASVSSAEYVLAPHGTPAATTVKFVSKHWISQCLEEGKLLDVGSHTLFRPLPCQIPLADLQGVKFCVSQYSERDRKLLRKLCYVLKVKFSETLNSKITHLLCKVQAGEKYENAERLGIRCVTANWLYACVEQNMAVPMDKFRPREPTAAEKEVEHSFMTQRPVRAGQPPSLTQTQTSNQQNPVPSQSMAFSSKSTRATTTRVTKVSTVRRNIRSAETGADCSQAQGTHLDPWDANSPSAVEAGNSNIGVKLSQESISQLKPVTSRPALQPSTRSVVSGNNFNNGEASVAGTSKPLDLASELDTPEPCRETGIDVRPMGIDNMQAFGVADSSAGGRSIMDHNNSEDQGTGNVVDAIEGLLRQTSKVQGDDLVEVMEVHKDLISSDAASLSRRAREESSHIHSDFKKPKLYPARSIKADGVSKSPKPTTNQDDSLRFDESQLDSQMVAYDEDHSERQNLMERVRTRSSSMALSSNNSVGARVTDKSAGAWKGDQKLGRLFRAAEANK